MKRGLKLGAALRVARRARRRERRLRLPTDRSLLADPQFMGEALPTPDYQAADRDMMMIVTGLLRPLEANVTKGRTEDNLGEIVSQWAGPAARWVSLGRITKRGPVRILQLQLANPAVAVTLRPRLVELVKALDGTGIAEVRL